MLTPTDRALAEIYARLKHQTDALGRQLDEHRTGRVLAIESCTQMHRTCRAIGDAAADLDRLIPRIPA